MSDELIYFSSYRTGGKFTFDEWWNVRTKYKRSKRFRDRIYNIKRWMK